MSTEVVRLPDGTEFPFWADKTKYATTYHVACEDPGASDDNPGTRRKPFRSIGRAAELLQPGERVVVHEGLYREVVRPARGGEGPDRMISYEAARGQEVVVKGSEVWKPEFRLSEGWQMRSGREARIWMADLPAEWFVGYNPFLATNVFGELMTFNQSWSTAEMHRLQLRRGMVFADGRPLKQVFRFWELAEHEGAFWVEDPGLRIHLRLWEDADPNGVAFEVTTREQAFAPAVRRLGYIRVRRFTFEHVADGIPVPQRAALSTAQGHHWIIEENVVRHVNACGIDVGAQHWSMKTYEPCGHHIIRNNRVSDCGVCGIAGVHAVDKTLVERNVVERIGGLDVERLYECAGMKFHGVKGMLLRRNVFREMRHASGLWLDFLNENSRVSENVFCDISSFSSALHLEVSQQPNLIDHNIFWDVRGEPWDKGNPHAVITGGHAIKADGCEYAVAAHNFFGNIKDGFALFLTSAQHQRAVGGRTGLARRLKALNNILFRCPKRVCVGWKEENTVDGNLYDETNDHMSFLIENPAPQATQNLRGWREFFGFDIHGTQAKLDATFDLEKLELSFQFEGDAPESQKAEELHTDKAGPCGPLVEQTWEKAKGGKRVKVKLPVGVKKGRK